MRSCRCFGERDAVRCTVQLMVEVELSGAPVDEQTLVGVHGAKFEGVTGSVLDEGGHLILVLAEKDAIISFADSL